MTTPDQAPQPQPGDTDIQQPFMLEVVLHGHGSAEQGEAFRRELNAAIGRKAFELSEKHGIMVRGLTVKPIVEPVGQIPPVPEAAPSEAQPEDAPVGPPMPEAAPTFGAEVQEKLNSGLAGTFMHPDDVRADIAEKKRNSYAAGGGEDYEPAAEDKPISLGRQREFTEAAETMGIKTVRHALIMGMDRVRDSVVDLRPNVLRRKDVALFDANVIGFVHGIIETIPDPVYNNLVPEGKEKTLLDPPMTFEQLQTFTKDPAEVPGVAIVTTANNGFGIFPETWTAKSVADLINPANHNSLVQSAIDEGLRDDQAERCLERAHEFSKALAGPADKA